MLGLMLEFRGYDVALAVDGRDALDAVLARRPDAIVSDMNMPGLDGLGLCRAVRCLQTFTSLPVILWSSAEADDPRLVETVALGGVEFLSKSLAVSTIDATLRRILRPPCPNLEESVAPMGADVDGHGFDRLPVDFAA